jgi:sec-independent protein translocase protein TatB
MSGIGGSEFILLCLIGLLILGPERLPRVARQLGGWLGKARQMTRAMQRQLEEELDTEKNFGINPKDLDPKNLMTPRDDDTYSPLHDEEDKDVATPAPSSEDTTEKPA